MQNQRFVKPNIIELIKKEIGKVYSFSTNIDAQTIKIPILINKHEYTCFFHQLC